MFVYWISIFLIFTKFTALFAGHDLTNKIMKINIESTYGSMRNRRQSSNGDNFSRESSMFPVNRGINNDETWNPEEEDDFLIFDDGSNNSQRTFPRQVPFDQFGPSFPNFQEDDPPPIPTLPGMGTRRARCEETCPSTPEYNPVCGDDNVTYPNIGKLQCAARCGKGVSLQFRGACLTKARGK